MPPEFEDLDEILGIQLTIAWAGETPGGDHPRLGWWNTDLIDAEGGGALWARLLPRTQLWAGLDAARRAAREMDTQQRKRHARADDLRTLFHFGFELDEALDERLAHHKLEAHPPHEVLPLLELTRSALDRAALLARLTDPALDTAYKVTPAGRQLKLMPDESIAAQARRLACAMLVEPPAQYPLPFILPEASRG